MLLPDFGLRLATGASTQKSAHNAARCRGDAEHHPGVAIGLSAQTESLCHRRGGVFDFLRDAVDRLFYVIHDVARRLRDAARRRWPPLP